MSLPETSTLSPTFLYNFTASQTTVMIESRPPRVGHKKSRKGCAQCKRRHVKCNEEAPCANCVRHGVACSLAGGPQVPRDDAKPRRKSSVEVPSASASGTSSRPKSSEDDTPRRQPSVTAAETGRGLSPPTLMGAMEGSTSPQSMVPLPGSPFAALSGLLDRGEAVHEQDWMLDLQLLHHYLTNTQRIMTENADMSVIWQEEAPSVAFKSDYVMHALLGFSALHKAHLQAQNSTVLHSSAIVHLDKALRLFRAARGPASAENSEAQFVFTWLVALFAYALPPPFSLGGASSVDSLTELFQLAKGIDTILSETWFWVVHGPFAPILTRGFQVDAPDQSSTSALLEGMDVGLTQLDFLINIEAMTFMERRVCTSILAELKQLYTSIFSSPGSTPLSAIICFPRQETAFFCQLIRQRRPQALVLLAYYCVLLDVVDSKWWMEGRAIGVLNDICTLLDDEWRHWIQWPIQAVMIKGHGSMATDIAIRSQGGGMI